MYDQCEDTLLLIDSISEYSGSSVLEIGVGSGGICRKLIENFSFVVGTDVEIESIKSCKKNISKIHWICCDVVSAICGKFDLIVSNPPYLPNEDIYDIQDRTIYGGKEGIELTCRFIEDSIPLLKMNGKIIIVCSSLANLESLENFISYKNLEKKIINTKKIFFETLYVYELKFKS
ncbi:MAG: methyltransferase [Nitrososphaeraceae archaeon]|nr:methyltransferase [Nitrososphaeraceae archaeon]